MTELTENKYSLQHETYRDDMGVLRDSLKFIVIKESGLKEIHPFIGFVKAKKTSNQNLLDATEEYIRSDLEQMFREQINKYESAN